MLDIIDNPIYDKVKELLVPYSNADDEFLSSNNLFDIFNGNFYNCGFFLLNFSEAFSLEKPLNSLELDLKNFYIRDLIKIL